MQLPCVYKSQEEEASKIDGKGSMVKNWSKQLGYAYPKALPQPDNSHPITIGKTYFKINQRHHFTISLT